VIWLTKKIAILWDFVCGPEDIVCGPEDIVSGPEDIVFGPGDNVFRPEKNNHGAVSEKKNVLPTPVQFSISRAHTIYFILVPGYAGRHGMGWYGFIWVGMIWSQVLDDVTYPRVSWVLLVLNICT
jgi:hypothetical protein